MSEHKKTEPTNAGDFAAGIGTAGAGASITAGIVAITTGIGAAGTAVNKLKLSFSASALSGVLSLTSLFLTVSHLEEKIDNSVPFPETTRNIIEADPERKAALLDRIQAVMNQFNQETQNSEGTTSDPNNLPDNNQELPVPDPSGR